MYNFESYFCFENIAKYLCKIRIKEASKRHKIHLISDVSCAKTAKDNFQKKCHHNSHEIYNLMPPRRSWIRLKPEKRKKISTSTVITIQEVWRTILSTKIKVENKAIPCPEWFNRLNTFIVDIQNSVLNDNSEIDAPIILPEVKKIKMLEEEILDTSIYPPIVHIKKTHRTECRPISLFNLKSRVIIGLVSNYLSKIFDPYLNNSAMAFRAPKDKKFSTTHHDAVKRILAYKAANTNSEIWVAECDLQKFFDCVNHEVIISVFDHFKTKIIGDEQTIDPRSEKIFLQYLKKYSFPNSVFKVNQMPDYWKQFPYINNGFFSWPEKEIQNLYPIEFINKVGIGIPQGGALSCLIANLILHEADERLKNHSVEYIRFCDDMVILAQDEKTCTHAINEYINAVNSLKLIAHSPLNATMSQS